MNVTICKLLLMSSFVLLAGQSRALDISELNPALVADASRRDAPLIPPSEIGLKKIIADPWFTIMADMAELGGPDRDSNLMIIEGPIFDKQDNLYFTDVGAGLVMRLTPDGKLTRLLEANGSGAAGLGLHENGRIIVAGVGDHKSGPLFSIKTDGSDKKMILDPQMGYVPDDVALDNRGGFYFTDFRGHRAEPTGGVYYVAPDMKTITPIMTGMSSPNGLALSEDGNVLWVGETGTGLLHRFVFSAPTKLADVLGTTIRYHFGASMPDSMRLDKDGNLYVALPYEGRVLVFNDRGVPIGQVLLPDRDRGEFLFTTSMAIKPGTRELYIVSSGQDGRRAKIYRASAFAKGVDPVRPLEN